MNYTPHTCNELLDITNNLATFNSRKIELKGRIYVSRNQKNLCFLILRLPNNYTIQAVVLKKKIANVDELLSLTAETIIIVYGTLNLTIKPVEACYFKNIEIDMDKFKVISLAQPLPFLLTDKNRDNATVGLELCFANPWINARSIEQNIILRVRSKICELFRNFLNGQNFIEIHTPKLSGSSSEGGCEVFQVKYFDKNAYLAQSPQLYKQIAINSDLDRIYEIGPVFRAEKFSHNRHLCEFTSMDIEMSINNDYQEIIAMIKNLLTHIISNLNTFMDTCYSDFIFEKPNIDNIVTITHSDAIQLLNLRGFALEDMSDINNAAEKELGDIIKKQYGTDIFILDKFPTCLRPFYTMPTEHDTNISNSFDIIFRGQEILSGSQRQTDVIKLTKQIEDRGINPESLKYYLASFTHGSDLHGGCGIGLERLTSLYLQINNVKKATFIVRDPVTILP